MAKMRILLADSSSFCLDVEKWFLKESPVIIFTAEDGARAINLIRQVRPDLVYLEYALPVMDGVSCCRAIKADPDLAAIPVVMVAATDGAAVEECRDAGCDAVIVKPLNRREFLEVGRSFLGRINRREVRVPCRSSVVCRMEGNIFYGTIEDVSSNGMFVGATCAAREGDIIEMKFLLPGEASEVVTATARVAWVNGGRRRRNRNLPVGFGVVFQGLDTTAAERIQEFIEHTLIRQHPPDEW